ncbi:hydroxymethylbilane synthase [Pseudonocardia sp. NPDC049154]|uniref:hydroxymethylbilane synthase n=1 Tax=Pseudonocardia sp. NPDC049154 TaxID=3155501 RepID=UPI0033CCA779
MSSPRIRALRVGTRASTLARAQSAQVTDVIRAAGRPAELVDVHTTGDRSSAPIAQLGVGVFVAQLREALAGGEVDVAVHSYKDLPTAPDPRLTLAAVPAREDPRDALVTRDGQVLAELSAGSRIGTGSPRRAVQLHALGLGLEVVPIRGNVDTRIGKVTSGELDGVVVAAAGLRRLGRVEEASELLDPLQMLPAPAQGALAIECRADDEELARFLAATLNDAGVRAAVTAERAVLATLQAGCSAPVAAHASISRDIVKALDDKVDRGGRVVERLSLRAVVGIGIGKVAEGALLRAAASTRLVGGVDHNAVEHAEKLGAALAADLLKPRPLMRDVHAGRGFGI